MVPPPEVLPMELPAATPTAKEKKKVDLETKATSSESSSAKRSDRKKKKEPSPEPEEEEELTTGIWSSEGDDEGEEPAIPPPNNRRKMDTRSMDKKKPKFKTLVAPKRFEKTLGKGGSSLKKLRGK